MEADLVRLLVVLLPLALHDPLDVGPPQPLLEVVPLALGLQEEVADHRLGGTVATEEAGVPSDSRLLRVVSRRELHGRRLLLRRDGELRGGVSDFGVLVEQEVVAPDVVDDRGVVVCHLRVERVDLAVVVDDVDGPLHQQAQLADHPARHALLRPVASVVGRGGLGLLDDVVVPDADDVPVLVPEGLRERAEERLIPRDGRHLREVSSEDLVVPPEPRWR